MPITTATIAATPYVITHSPVATLHVNGRHQAHDPADRKDTQFAAIGANLTRVSFATNLAGHVYYLPFSATNIHSMELPANPGFPAVFVTANLDGCWIFLDRKANGNVVVYHANSSGAGFSPTVQQSATTPLFQTPAAIGDLNALYAAAAVHYNGVATTNHWVLKKDRYLREVNNRLLRKAGQGRTGVNFGAPEHASYTTFAGFHNGANWEFWFQTFSQFIYRRPKLHIKTALGKRDHDPDVVNDPYVMVEAVRWLTVP